MDMAIMMRATRQKPCTGSERVTFSLTMWRSYLPADAVRFGCDMSDRCFRDMTAKSKDSHSPQMTKLSRQSQGPAKPHFAVSTQTPPLQVNLKTLAINRLSAGVQDMGSHTTAFLSSVEHEF